MGWIEFALALTVFFGSHRIPALMGIKAPLTAALGARGYTVLFSLISTVLLFWVCLLYTSGIHFISALGLVILTSSSATLTFAVST